MVVPFISTEVSEMKKTRLKMSFPFSTPASSAYIERIIGTAPRRPTQDIKILERVVNCDFAKQVKTAIGRATRMIKADSSRPMPTRGSRSDGFTSSPSVRNMMICIIQA